MLLPRTFEYSFEPSMQAAVATYSPGYNDLVRENLHLKNLLEIEKQERLKLELQFKKFAEMVFGKKGERFISNADQLTLGLATDIAAPSSKIGEAKTITYTKGGHKSKRELNELHAYMQSLPHIYQTIEPANIPEGAVKIGEDRQETLEYIPGKAYVKVVITPIYKVPPAEVADTTMIISAPAPERPIFKCLAGASLLAQILVDKYCDHLPLFRQAKRFNRSGLALPYNTLVDLNAKAIDLIAPLYMVLKKDILASSYIHADETGLKVLMGKENKHNKGVHGGYLWGYMNSIENMVFFDYQSGRGEKCTDGILKQFTGVLQTDGWKVYKSLVSKYKQITQICCWAHARRKYFDALPFDRELAEYALKKIGALYDIERICREQNLDYDQIAQVRQELCMPVLEALEQWMKNTYINSLQSSHITAAVGYSLERWNELCYYINDGKLKIDNNPIERSIRPIALGRKNFLFAGSPKGAERLAIMYSLMGTCTLNNIDPYEWLKDVIGSINNYSMTNLHELLPHNWKKSHPEAIIPTPAAA